MTSRYIPSLMMRLSLTLLSFILLPINIYSSSKLEGTTFSVVRIFIHSTDREMEDEVRSIGLTIVDRHPDYIDAYIPVSNLERLESSGNPSNSSSDLPSSRYPTLSSL